MPYRIYKRKGSPNYQAYVSVKTGGASERVRVSTGETVRDKAIEFARDIEAYMLAAAGRIEITIDQAFGEFYKLEGQKCALPLNIFYTLRQMSRFFGGGKSFSRINAADVNSYIYHMERLKRAPGTINRHLVIPSSVISTCCEKWRHRAPDIRPLRFKRREPDGRIWLVNDNDRILIMENAAPHLRLMMEIAYYTGLRRGNILSLRWDEVDFEHKSIKKYVKDANVKGGRAHTVFIPQKLLGILEGLPRECDHVVQFNGRPVKEIKTAFAAACRRANTGFLTSGTRAGRRWSEGRRAYSRPKRTWG